MIPGMARCAEVCQTQHGRPGASAPTAFHTNQTIVAPTVGGRCPPLHMRSKIRQTPFVIFLVLLVVTTSIFAFFSSVTFVLWQAAVRGYDRDDDSFVVSIARWQAELNVPVFDPDRQAPNAYPAGAFVRGYIDGEWQFFYHLGNPHWTTALDSHAWIRVFSFEENVGVMRWSQRQLYDMAAFGGRIVYHNGRYFERWGANATVGVAPEHQPDAWRQIFTWNDVSQPVDFTPQDWSANRIFRYAGGYFALVAPTWQANPERPTDADSVRFRRILEWQDTASYTAVGGLPWGTGGQSHAYTFDPITGERIFWEVRPGVGTISGHMPYEGSLFWRRHAPEVNHQTIITHQAGRAIVWVRTDSSPNPPPPNYGTVWQERVVAVTAPLVYQIVGDDVILWRNLLPAGNTQPIGGDGWVRVLF